MKLRYATVCSGIDAPAVAWNPLGWEQVFCSEIEVFPSAVLKHHHPNVPNYGDMTQYEKWPSHQLDVLIGGTPCQSFSVAGLRKGLADPRGNLALTFLAIVERYAPTFVIWENVPGVFSSWSDVAQDSQTDECREAGRTAVNLARALGFDAKAAGQFGCLEEVDQSNDLDCFTAGLGQLGYGWALASLDAQYFGVAQRRERVFVVGHIGGEWQRAAAVLFDRESLCGNPAPRREKGKAVAGTFGARAKAGGGFGTDFELGGGLTSSEVATVDAQNKVDRGDSAHAERLVVQHEPIPINMQSAVKNGKKSPNGTGIGEPGYPANTLGANDRHAIGVPLVAATLRSCSNTEAGHGARAGDKDENLVCHTLRAEHDASEDGTGRGTPIVIAHGQGNAEMVKDGEPSLTCNHEAPICFKPIGIDEEQNATIDHFGTLKAREKGGGFEGAIAFERRMVRTTGGQPQEELQHALRSDANSGDGAPCVARGMAVRRLTPRECERLQGFPDDFTLIPIRGKPAADGPRYKAIGNSMAVPKIRWLGQRIELVHKLSTTPCE